MQSQRTLLINVTSSAGSGKTTLMQETARRLKDRIKMAVLVGDLETERNAIRIREAGIMADSLFGRQTGGSLAGYNLAELETLLDSVIAKEDYESASEIRDYIEKRKSGTHNQGSALPDWPAAPFPAATFYQILEFRNSTSPNEISKKTTPSFQPFS